MTDPASKWFPALGNLRVGVVKTDAAGQTIMETVPAKRQMTISGPDASYVRAHLRRAWLDAGAQDASGFAGSSAADYTAEEFIERLSKVNLLYQPGSAWDYGLSIDVLGLIIEAESGQTLGSYLQQRIWKSLGMVDTGFVIPPEKVKRYAKALPIDPDTGKPQTVADRTKPTRFECGGGCAASTAGDYVRFAQMLLNRGRLGDMRVLGSKSVDYMTADHLGPEIASTSSALIRPGRATALA